jgi:ribosomal protein L29
MEMKKLEIEDKKAQAALLTAQAAMGKAEGHHQIEEMKTQIAIHAGSDQGDHGSP